MTDPFVLDDEPFVFVVPASANIPPGNITGPEWDSLKSRVTNLEGWTLTNLDDVDLAGLFGGATLIFDSSTGLWKPGTVQGSIALVSQNWAPVTNVPDVDHLVFTAGISVAEGSSPGIGLVALVFGGSGSASTPARSDHTHTILLDTRQTYGATGTLSGGTRALVSRSISLSSSSTYIIKARLTGDLRGEGAGAGYTLPSITIGTNTVNRHSDVRTVSGVDREFTTSHPGVQVSGLSSVTVSADIAYQAGDPINVGAGELVISIELNR